MSATPFIADLHVHSKYSRATARDLDLHHLHLWSQRKGIRVVGSGDFTHPAWYSHLADHLEPAEPGLYRLKADEARHVDEGIPASCRAPVRFMLSCEISNIYKKDGRTRKNHNLVFFSDLEHVRRFNLKMEAIGNIHSDGRPILGLDARDLLEIVLETADDAFLVPAHIWTPWFSMLGSKSGFDSMEECFGDLSRHIFAVETGLSSDPEMNWRVGDLDHVTLISNSDAHSPSKLGREANLLNSELSFQGIRSALESGDKEKFLGTFEFYPEEGKYHVDGHRKCNVRFSPRETKAHHGNCPVCHKPLTLGVLHRVDDLATRPEDQRPQRSFPFHRLLSLDNLLSEIFRVGPQSKKVQQAYQALLQNLGSELNILHFMDIQKIERAGVPLLGEAIARMRDNRITFLPGYDGVYGTASIFSDQERRQLLGQRHLFNAFENKMAAQPAVASTTQKRSAKEGEWDARSTVPQAVIRLNHDQQRVVDHGGSHLMVVAGPGTGKTRTLTHKITRLIEAGADAGRILAVTFTNKAANEMRQRLDLSTGQGSSSPFVGTFHALGCWLLNQSTTGASLNVLDESGRKALLRDVRAMVDSPRKTATPGVEQVMAWIVLAKQQMRSDQDSLQGIVPPDHLEAMQEIYRRYEKLMRLQNVVDFEDLIFRSVRLLESGSDVAQSLVKRFDHLFIDEFQDINAGQYRLMHLLCGSQATVCAIGDPDQSIYGFRGSDLACFKGFMRDFADAEVLRLRQNYRSVQTILDVSTQVIRHNPEVLGSGHRQAVYSERQGERTIHIMERPSASSEAVAIGKIIERMIGGTGFFSIDSGAVDPPADVHAMSFADFAILLRTHGQVDAIVGPLEKAGIPCQVVSRGKFYDHPGIQSLLSLVKLGNGRGDFSDLSPAAPLLQGAVSDRTQEIFRWWAYGNEMTLETALNQARRFPIPRLRSTQQRQLFELTDSLVRLKQQMKNRPLTEQLQTIIRDLHIDQKYRDDADFEGGCRRILQTGADFANDVDGFLAAVSLSSDADTYDHRVEKVAVMTMHAAKGLEFPVVFIAGCEDGWIPYRRDSRPVDMEEERRLFYVAITRAGQHLFLSAAANRTINGMKQSRCLSPFVNDIENRYKQVVTTREKKSDMAAQKQLTLFQ